MKISKSRFLLEIAIVIIFFGFWVSVIIIGVRSHFSVPMVKSIDFHKWIAVHQPIIIDLRESIEIERDPLDYQPTIHLPFLYIKDRLEHISIPQNHKILLVCSDGNRARLIASLLYKRGIKSYYLKSGLHYVNRTRLKN